MQRSRTLEIKGRLPFTFRLVPAWCSAQDISAVKGWEFLSVCSDACYTRGR